MREVLRIWNEKNPMSKQHITLTPTSVLVLALLLILFAGLTPPVSAQQLLWARQFGGVEFERAEAVSVDASGVYVAGIGIFLGEEHLVVRRYTADGGEVWTSSSLRFGETDPIFRAHSVSADFTGVYVAGERSSPFGHTDIFVRKLDLTGNEVWRKTIGSSDDDTANAIVADSRPETGTGIWVVGGTGGILPVKTFEGLLLAGDAFIYRFNQDGTEICSRQFGTTSSDTAFGISVHSTGVYVTGFTSGGFAGAVINGNDPRIFVRKFDFDCRVIWTLQFGHHELADDGFIIANNVGKAIAVDDSGVYVTGARTSDAFIRKFGFDGNEIWRLQFGVSFSEARSISVHSSGLYVTAAICFDRETGFPFCDLPSDRTNGFVRKFDPNGVEQWTRQFGTLSTTDGIAVDDSGVYVVGNLRDSEGFIHRYDFDSSEVWRRNFSPPVFDRVEGTAAHTSGIYVAGITSGTLPGQTSAGEEDVFVRKYDLSGLELWTRQFGSSGGEFLAVIAVDASGVYVAGTVASDRTLPGQSSAGKSDAFVRKYDFSGNEQWTRQFGTDRFEGISGVSVDSSGVYVVGRTSGAFPGETRAGTGADEDVFVRKYGVNGNEIWTDQFGSPEGDFSILHNGGIAVDDTGVYVAGTTLGTLPGQTDPDGPDLRDAFVRKYDLNGNEVWTRQFGDFVNGIAVHGSGVYVAGNLGGTNSFVRKYDQNGNEGWTREFGSTDVSLQLHAISASVTGVYVAGRVSGPLPGQTHLGQEDAFVRRYDFNGNEIWTNQFGTVDRDIANAVSSDASGVYVGGATHGVFPGEIGAGAMDAFVAKLDAGVLLDVTPPVITVPADFTVEATGPSGAAVTYTVTAQDDFDGPVTPLCSPTSSSVFPLGPTRIDCSATDSAANIATASFTVMVVDSTPPSITAPQDIVKEATGPLTPVSAAELGTALVMDTVDPSPSVTNDAPASFPLGTTVVTWTATDRSGNRATATQEVRIVDTTPPPQPSLLSPQDGSFVNDSTPTFDWTDVVDPSGVTYNFMIASADPTRKAPVLESGSITSSTFTPASPLADGTYHWLVEVRDGSGNQGPSSTLFTVTIDTVAPSITNVPSSLTVEAGSPQGATATFATPTASDVVDGTVAVTCDAISDVTVFPYNPPSPTENPVTCTSTDRAGNTSTASFTVTVVDTTLPETSIVSAVDAVDGNGNPVGEGTLTVSTSITVSFEGTDLVGIGSFSCVLDGGRIELCGNKGTIQSVSYSELAPAVHTLQVQAVDTSGNLDATPATFTWTIIELTSPPGTDTTTTSDENGNTIITTNDESGEEIVEITLPPGTEVPSGTMTVNCTTTGQNNACETTGVNVPYPPGKSIEIRSNPSSNHVCIVDSPDSVLAVGLPSCGKTDTSISQVVMRCNEQGVTETFTGFPPNTPFERAYTCTKIVKDGKTFMKVDGLAFSFVLDGADVDGVLDALDACPTVSGLPENNGCPSSRVTDSRLCGLDRDTNLRGDQFRLIFIQDPMNPSTFKLVGTNPGQMYYNVFLTGTPNTNGEVSVDVGIPYPFVTQGSVPIHLFKQVRVEEGCFVPFDELELSGFTLEGTTTITQSGSLGISLEDYTVQEFGSTITLRISGPLPSSGLVYITFHLDYGPKGTGGYCKDPANNAVLPGADGKCGTGDETMKIQNLATYSFSQASAGFQDIQNVQNVNAFKRDPGFAGFVRDNLGDPIPGARVEIWTSTGTLLATVYADEDGFYQYQYKHTSKPTTFIIRIPEYGLEQSVVLKAMQVVYVNFVATDRT